MRCFQQQSRGFSSLPQPIERHEALKNDVESGGVKRAFVDRLSPVFVPRTTLRDEWYTRTITLDIRLNSSLHLKIFLLT